VLVQHHGVDDRAEGGHGQAVPAGLAVDDGQVVDDVVTHDRGAGLRGRGQELEQLAQNLHSGAADALRHVVGDAVDVDGTLGDDDVGLGHPLVVVPAAGAEDDRGRGDDPGKVGIGAGCFGVDR